MSVADPGPPLAGRHSALWGARGEAWSPAGPLPDFSFAGCYCGERPIPLLPAAADVRAFGAVGDGVTDDTQAFRRAIAATLAGAVLVPAGRYLIRDVVTLDRAGLALRGEGPRASVLVFDRTLTDAQPDWGATTTGQRTSNYSWSGGFLRIAGDLGLRPLAPIAAPAARGQRSVQLSSVEALALGQWVGLQSQDDAHRTLARALYQGDPGPIDRLPPVSTWQAARVLGLDRMAGRVQLDRPLRVDLRPEWGPQLLSLAPRVTGSGIEGLGFEFPPAPWRGEFTELGYNAIALDGVAHCWVRDVRIHNAESGIFVKGLHCTVEGVVLTSDKPVQAPEGYGAARGCVGHHGIELGGADHLVHGFDFQACYVHDLTVDGCSTAGNVFSGGRGLDLCLDHHGQAPHANLFSALDCGAGGRPWRSGGGEGLGRHAGAWTVLWGLRAAGPMALPTPGWAAPGLSLVGCDLAPGKLPGAWIERIAGLEPGDLHAAQLARRLAAAQAGRG